MPAVRQADVVDDAGQISFGGMISRIASSTRSQSARRLLDARAARRAQVQLELAAVDGREEVLADPRQQRERRDAAQQEHRRRTRAVRAPQRSSSRVIRRRAVRSNPTSKCACSRTSGLRLRQVLARIFRMRPQQELRHRRHQRARQQVGREHREHDRFGHRHEQITRRRRSGRTSARTRCRCTASRRTPASQSAARRRESPLRSACPARGCG